jgi:hypothetical protein
MSRFFYILILGIGVLTFILSACNPSKKKGRTPAAFNLNSPEKFTMPSSLLEISGLTFSTGNQENIYCIQDEAGKIFRLTWGQKKNPAG